MSKFGLARCEKMFENSWLFLVDTDRLYPGEWVLSPSKYVFFVLAMLFSIFYKVNLGVRVGV